LRRTRCRCGRWSVASLPAGIPTRDIADPRQNIVDRVVRVFKRSVRAIIQKVSTPSGCRPGKLVRMFKRILDVDNGALARPPSIPSLSGRRPGRLTRRARRTLNIRVHIRLQMRPLAKRTHPKYTWHPVHIRLLGRPLAGQGTLTRRGGPGLAKRTLDQTRRAGTGEEDS
jgi:hypothetical protein